MQQKIVIALGGNALGDTPFEQLRLIEHTSRSIVDLIEQNYQVIITHGNGPQVGMIQLGLSFAAEMGSIKSEMPFPECGAMSQGYIGYHLQNGIYNELKVRGITCPVTTLVTQVLVDENDPAFQKPTKPIGSFYSQEQADTLIREKGYIMVEDSGRGYRRVVPSPKPVDIIEKDSIRTLIGAGHMVIASGGGGIPVVERDGALFGVSAVIDKDFAAAKLAELVQADMLVILTAVDRVAVNFGQPDQRELAEISVDEAGKLCAEGHFAPGSMLPKVQACMTFARAGGKALIASLQNAAAALKGESGTRIVR